MEDWLYSLQGRGSVLGLERVKELLSKLNNPQSNLKCIHVAGTNGKGSTCAILSSILKEADYKVGMYTSPHLKRFTERIQINGEEITQPELNRLIEKIKPLVTDQTFFEVTTAIAFQYFKEQDVDFAILEVGLGGRLDATNVITPLISIITHISLEHTHILGKTIEEIAKEKAGIIKENIPVITLAKNKTIKEIAKQKHSEIFIPKIPKLNLNLKGEFQLENASLAIKAAELLNINSESIKKGLESVKWPGRLEFLEKNVLVDCAHNPEGIAALKKEIKKLNYEKIITVTGILKDKDKKTMITQLSEFSDYIIFTKPNTERAEEPEELKKLTNTRNEIIIDVKKALKKAKKLANPDDLILITGSIYIVGEVKASPKLSNI